MTDKNIEHAEWYLSTHPAQQQECNHCGGTGDVSGEYPGVACPECSGSGVQVEPEFFTHSVEQPYDWSDWVCPDPKSYLMKCCDCGLVHEAQFGVVRYKSETEREGCDMVDDPNLQAVFRMRRSEQWSPEDTAHRAGGLPMAEQPAQQEPVAWLHTKIEGVAVPHRPADLDKHPDRWTALYPEPKPCPTCEALARTVMMDQTAHDKQRKPLTDEQIMEMYNEPRSDAEMIEFARAIEAAHGIKGDA